MEGFFLLTVNPKDLEIDPEHLLSHDDMREVFRGTPLERFSPAESTSYDQLIKFDIKTGTLKARVDLKMNILEGRLAIGSYAEIPLVDAKLIVYIGISSWETANIQFGRHLTEGGDIGSIVYPRPMRKNPSPRLCVEIFSECGLEAISDLFFEILEGREPEGIWRI